MDPNQERMCLTRVLTYTGDYHWLCRKDYLAWQPKVPERIDVGDLTIK
jgi:hypothetical protein